MPMPIFRARTRLRASRLTGAERPAPAPARAFKESMAQLTAVAPLDLDIYPRDFVAMLGPSGCGKTTLLAHDRRFRRADHRHDRDRRRRRHRARAREAPDQHGVSGLWAVSAHECAPEHRLWPAPAEDAQGRDRRACRRSDRARATCRFCRPRGSNSFRAASSSAWRLPAR